MIDRCITTRSGVRFDVLDPKPEDFVIEDIAHALSNVCRYGGHCHPFVSVAEHSMLVSRILEDHLGRPDLALTGLLHDASEAYLTDLPRPFKAHAVFSTFVHVEQMLERHIAARFGTIYPMPPEVKTADNMALLAEANVVMDVKNPAWAYWFGYLDVPVVEIKHRFFRSGEAKIPFLLRYQELTHAFR